VQFVFIDTTRLRGERVEGLSATEAALLQQQELEWLNQTLRTSIADYLIVVGHYVVYSSGIHT
jgi:hypothetical protein